MKVDLIPCPDCGSAAQLDEGCYVGSSQLYSYVHCTNPLCHLFEHTAHFWASSQQECNERAALSWNERYAGFVCEKDAISLQESRQIGRL